MLNTKRLHIVFLTITQLDLWINHFPAIKKEQGFHYQADPIEGFFKEIIQEQIQKIKQSHHNYLFYSCFFLIRKFDKAAIGSFVFKDAPNALAEIGYGLSKNFQHQSYMDEIIQIISQ